MAEASINADFGVRIPLVENGGFGDIALISTICEYLSQIGVPFRFSDYDRKAVERLEIAVGQPKVQEWLAQKEEPTDTYPVCFSPLRNKMTDSRIHQLKACLVLEEYDRPRGDIYLDEDNVLRIKTGLTFSFFSRKVQAGLYLRPCLDSILDEIDKYSLEWGKETAISRIRKEKGASFERIEDIVLPTKRWAIGYSSSLDNNWNYFDILNQAAEHLDRPLLVFTTIPAPRLCQDKSTGVNPDSQKSVLEKAKKLGFNYHNVDNNIDIRTGSPISIVELGSVSETLFHRLISATDTLSLVTGDHSFTNMMQKISSAVPVPFCYHTAIWKKTFAKRVYQHMKKHDKEAAELFKCYTKLQKNGEEPAHARLAELVYNKERIGLYIQAMAGIKKSFIAERREAGVEQPEMLWSVMETAEFIARRMHEGMSKKEAIGPLLPRLTDSKYWIF